MINLYDFPLLVLVASFAGMVLTTWLGTVWVRRRGNLDANMCSDFSLMQSSTLTLLVGHGAHKVQSGKLILVILTFVVSVSFFLIADIDSPNVGVILVQPHNLLYLADSLRAI